MFYAAPWIHQGIYGLNLVLGVAMCWGGWASNVIHPYLLQRHWTMAWVFVVSTKHECLERIVSRWWFHFFFSFSAWKLGRSSNLTGIFFRWVETTNWLWFAPHTQIVLELHIERLVKKFELWMGWLVEWWISCKQGSISQFTNLCQQWQLILFRLYIHIKNM